MDTYTQQFILDNNLNVIVGLAPVDLIYDKATKKQYSVLARLFKCTNLDELIKFISPNSYIYTIQSYEQMIEQYNKTIEDLNIILNTKTDKDYNWIIRYYVYENGVRVIFDDNIISCTLNNEEWTEYNIKDEVNEKLENKLPIKNVD